MSKHRRSKARSLPQSTSPFGEFAYFENGKRQVVQVFNKGQFQKKLMELDNTPWIDYRYHQLRKVNHRRPGKAPTS